MNEDSRQSKNEISVLTYNLWHGRAQGELAGLAGTHDPDVMCVQEARGSALPRRIGAMQLAITTSRNRLAVAVYVKSARFEVEDARTSQVTVSRHDRYVGGTDHRVAAARVTDRLTGRQMVLGSFHATPFTDSNAVRRRQVDDAHNALKELGPGLPFVMAGDYNHPILLFMLQLHLKRQGISTAHTSSSTFHKDGSLMRGKFDLATMSRFGIVSAETLPQGASDHKPVIFTMHYGQ